MTAPLFWKKLLVRTGIARLLPSVRRLTDGGAEFLRYYGDRVLAAPVAELLDEAAFPEAHGPDAIHLAMPAPRPDPATPSPAGARSERPGAPDPWGLPELRAEIAAARLDAAGQRLSPADEVLITHGATGAFRAVLDAFVNAGSRVVTLDPCSPLFTLGLKHRRARIRRVPTWLDDGRTRFHMAPFVKALRGARLLVLADPANPTGGVLAAEDLEQIAWWADRYDVLVYLDESFARFRYQGEPNRLPALPRAARRTLCAGSVSKGHGLAGLRVGWLTGCRHLLRACALTQALTAPFVPALCQRAALAALRAGDGPAAAARAAFEGKRRYAYDRLKALGLRPGWPGGGFFFWVPVGHLGLSGREFALRLLRSKRVLVNPGDVYGPSGAGFVRLSFAADEGRLREGLARLAEFVHELRPAVTAAPALETAGPPVAVKPAA